MKIQKIRGSRTYVVVGQLCLPGEAPGKLRALRQEHPESFYDWGLAKIIVGKGESPTTVSKIQLPTPPALLKRLEGLLSKRAVRTTQAGKEALSAVRAALGRHR